MGQEEDRKAQEEAEDREDEAEEGLDVRRLVTLIVVLVVLIGLTVVTRFYYRSKRSENVVAAREMVEAAESYIQDRQYLDAGDLLERAVQLDDENIEAQKRYAAVLFRVGPINPRFVLDGVTTVNKMVEEHPKETAVDFQPMAYEVVRRFGASGPRISENRLGDADVAFIRDISFLWQISQRITEGTNDDKTRVLMVLAWLRQQVTPLQKTHLPAMPRDALFRGYAGPAPMAWTFGTLVQQLGLKPYVVELVNWEDQTVRKRLVAVLVDGELLLFDPLAGIPLLADGDHHIVTFDELRKTPEILMDLEVADAQYQVEPERVKNALVGIVLHPYMLLPRMHLVSKLVAELPDHQTFAIDLKDYLTPWQKRDWPVQDIGEKLPVGSSEGGPRLDVWPIAFDTLVQYTREEFKKRRSAQYWALGNYQPGRDLVLRGNAKNAALWFNRYVKEVNQQRAEDVKYQESEAKKQFDEEIAFFEAQALFLAGLYEKALSALDAFAEQYPESKWHVLAAQLRAASVEKLEGLEAARTYWRNLPAPRNVYGVLRARGILPLVKEQPRKEKPSAPGEAPEAK